MRQHSEAPLRAEQIDGFNGGDIKSYAPDREILQKGRDSNARKRNVWAVVAAG